MAQTDISVIIKGNADRINACLNSVRAKIQSTFSNPSASMARMNTAMSNFRNATNAKLDSVKRKIQETFSGKEVSDFTKMVRAGAFMGVIAGLERVGESAVKAAANMEQTRTAFTNMLGSAEKAGKFIKDLQNFAAETPFEFNQVKGAAQKFLAFGFQAKQVIPTLTAVGNAASALGMQQDGIDRITLALGQMAAKGKVSGDEMRQLAEAGIPVWQMLADKIGVSIPEAMDMCSKGAINAQTGLEAIIGGMNERFGGMMEQQSQTMLGLWSTIQDNLGLILTEVGNSLTEAFNLKPILDSVGDFLDQFRDRVQKNGISEAIKQMIPPYAIAAIGALTAALVTLGVVGFSALVAPIATAVVALAPVLAIVGAVGAAAALLYKYFDNVKKIFTAVTSTFQGFQAVGQSLRNALNAIINALQGLLVALSPILKVFGVVIVGAIGIAIGAFLGFLNIVAYVISFALNIFSSLVNGAAKIFTHLGHILDWVGDVFMWLADKVLPDWASNGIKAIASFVGDAVDWLNDLIGKIKEVASWLGILDGAELKASKDDGKGNSETKTVKASAKMGTPKFDNFAGGGAGSHAGGGGGGGHRGGGAGGVSQAQQLANQLKQQAEQLSKSIEDEYMNTFSTKVELADRWYNTELAELEKSKSANENYERDKQRITELYAKKRLDALLEEQKQAREIQNNIRDLSLDLATSRANSNDNGIEGYYQKMAIEHEKATNQIMDKWQNMADKYASMTKDQQAIFRKAMQDRGIAYELDANNNISFHQAMNEQLLALDKDYNDKRNEAYAQGLASRQEIQNAINQGNFGMLQQALETEDEMHAEHYEIRKQMMQEYVDAVRDSQFESQQMWFDVMKQGCSQLEQGLSGILQGTMTVSQAFQKMGQAMLKAVTDYIAHWIASRIKTALLGKTLEKQEAAASIATAQMQIPYYQQLALYKSMATWGASATAGAAAFTAATASGMSAGAFSGIMLNPSQTAFANGGIVTGPTNALIGEGRYHEAVLPLNETTYGSIGEGIAKNGGGGNNITLNVSTMDAESFGDWLRSKGGQILRQYTLDSDREFTVGAGVW